MPKLGESIMEATILKWHKQAGDAVKMDETVLEIATDKVDSEVPSTAEGVLQEILYKVDDVVPIGTVIARIKTGADSSSVTPVTTPSPAVASETSPPQENPAPAMKPASQPVAEAAISNAAPGSNKFYSPLVLNIAASEGVSLAELEKIAGSGNEGRVTKKDILQYVSDKKSGKVPVSSASAPAPAVMQEPIASLPAAPQVSAALTITFNGDSWVEILGADNHVLERGLLTSALSSALL